MRLKDLNEHILRKQMDKKRQRSESDDSVGSLVEFIAPDEVVSDEVKIPVAEEDIVEVLKQEAEEFTKNLTATIVNGRTLRSRDPKDLEKRKPRDMYYERFGKAEEERLMEKFTKKDIIEFLKKLESENRKSYEDSGNTWPVLNTKMSLDKITGEYKKVKLFLDLPDSDDESEDEQDLGEDDEFEDSDDELSTEEESNEDDLDDDEAEELETDEETEDDEVETEEEA